VSDMKFENLSKRKDSAAALYLQELSRKEYIEKITMLPDLHWKDSMLVPSSIVIETKDVFIPQFTSVGINCGMTLVDTGVPKNSITIADLQNIFGEMNRYAYAIRSQKMPYLKKQEEMAGILKGGAAFMAQKHCIKSSILDNFENRGYINVGLDDKEIIESIPPTILKTGIGQKEMGFDFSGNHFLEFQVIDEIFDEDSIRQLHLNPDNLYCFIHTGPDSFTGNLLRFYTYDSDMSFYSRILIFLAKLGFHKRDTIKIWNEVFKKGVTPILPDSETGKRVFEVYNMCMNYGYAYRFAAFENLKLHLNGYFLESFDARVVWDVAHNSITCADENGGKRFWHRHNCSAIVSGRPVLIAGYNNVNSLIGIGIEQPGGPDSFDHGFGTLIKEELNCAGKGDEGMCTVRTRFGRRSGTRIIESDRIHHCSTNVMLQNAEIYEKRKVLRLAASLRPIANFKN
jgi:hypothetical protein